MDGVIWYSTVLFCTVLYVMPMFLGRPKLRSVMGARWCLDVGRVRGLVFSWRDAVVGAQKRNATNENSFFFAVTVQYCRILIDRHCTVK
jgi:hypothetical protein